MCGWMPGLGRFGARGLGLFSFIHITRLSIRYRHDLRATQFRLDEQVLELADNPNSYPPPISPHYLIMINTRGIPYNAS